MKMSPLQVCLEGSKDEADAGVMFLCVRKAKKPNVRYTHMAGPIGLRLEVRRHK